MQKVFIVLTLFILSSVNVNAEAWEGKWMKTKDDTLTYFVKGVDTNFKVVKSKEKTGDQFRMYDPDGRMFECENGLGYCREVVAQRYRELQEFNGYVKSK